MALFDTLKEVFHHIGLDNPYNFAVFYRASLHLLKPLVDDVT